MIILNGVMRLLSKKGIRMTTVLLIVMFTSLFSSSLMELKAIQEQIEYANRLNDESLLDSSIKEIQKIMLNSPGDVDFESRAYVVLGDAYHYKGNFLKAAENYEKAMNILPDANPQYAYALYSRIYSYYYLFLESNTSTAGSYYQTALRLLDELDDYEAYNQDAILLRGMFLKQNGDLMQALSYFDRISRDDLKGLALYYKGLVLYEQGNYPSAIIAFQNAERQGQNDDLIAASIYQVINSMLNLKDYRKALQYSRELIRDFGDSKYKNEIFTQHVELLYRTGDYDNAKGYVRDILMNTDNLRDRMQAYNILGWLAYNSGQIGEAFDNWRQAVETGHSQYPSRTFEIAKSAINALRETGDSAKMLSFLNDLKSRFPDKASELNLETAKVYMSLNRFSEAEALLKKVQASGLFFQEVNYQLAVLYKEMGDSNASLDYIDRVINSGDREYVYRGYLFKGDLFYRNAEYERAKTAYENALENATQPERLQCIFNLGMVALEQQDYANAYERFGELKRLSDENLEIALNGALYLAEVYREQGNNSAALNEYEWIIDNDTTGSYIPTALMKKFELLLKTGNTDSVINQLDNELNRTSDLELKNELRYLKAEAYMNKGDLLSAYNTAIETNVDRLSPSSRGGVLYIKGKYFMSQGNESNMERNFTELMENYPNSPKTPWAMQDYALYYYNNQDYNQSKNLFFKLFTTYPDFSKADTAYFYIGLCYEKMGENGKAKSVFEDFIEKYPNSSKLGEARQQLNWLD